MSIAASLCGTRPGTGPTPQPLYPTITAPPSWSSASAISVTLLGRFRPGRAGRAGQAFFAILPNPPALSHNNDPSLSTSSSTIRKAPRNQARQSKPAAPCALSRFEMYGNTPVAQTSIPSGHFPSSPPSLYNQPPLPLRGSEVLANISNSSSPK